MSSPTPSLGRHVEYEQVKDGHVKDAAQDVARDVAEDVLGAAKDGSVKVFIVAHGIFQGRNPCPTHACRPLALPLGDT